MTYVSSALFDESPLYDSDVNFNDMLGLFMFWGAYGLMWIHSTYPNYMLADSADSSGGAYGDGYVYAPLVFDSDTTREDPLWSAATALNYWGPGLFADSDGNAKGTAEILDNVKAQLGWDWDADKSKKGKSKI